MSYNDRSVNLPLRRLTLIAGTCLVGALWLWWKGPVPVLRGTTPLPQTTPFWYMESAFIALGILLCDLVDQGRDRWMSRASLLLATQVVALIAISSLRLDARIPLSGHAALFAFLVWRKLSNRSAGVGSCGRFEAAAGVILLVVVGYIKIVWWDDVLSLSMGILVGILIGLAGAGMDAILAGKK